MSRHLLLIVFLLGIFAFAVAKPLHSDTVRIYGQIRDVRLGSMVTFFVNDYVLGRQLNHYSSLDKDGKFEIKFTVRNTQDIFWRYNQDTLLRLIVSPGDSLKIIVNKAGIRFFGIGSQTNIDFSRLWERYEKAFSGMEESKALRLEPERYFEFRVKQKDKQIKFLESYCERYPCSPLLKQWFLADCEVSYFRELLAFGWKSNKYGVGSATRLSDERSKKYKSSFMKLSWVDGSTNLIEASHLSAQSDNRTQQGQLVDPGAPRCAMSSSYMSLINDLSNNCIRSRIYSEAFLQYKIGFLLDEKDSLTSKEIELLEDIRRSCKTEKDIDSLKRNEYYVLVRRYNDRILPKLLKKNIDFTFSEAQKVDSPRARDLILTQRFSHYLEDVSDVEYFYRTIVNKISDSSFVEAITSEYNDVKVQTAKTDQLLLREFDGVVLAKADYEKSGDQLINSILLDNRNKVIFLDFWGTWCGSCRADFATMSPLKNSPPFDSVRFVYLCVRSQEKDWVQMIKKYNLKGTHYLVTEKQYADFEKRFRISGYPTYFVIDKKRKLHTGIRVSETKALAEKLNELVKLE